MLIKLVRFQMRETPHFFLAEELMRKYNGFSFILRQIHRKIKEERFR